jgi:hypothetical protein
MESGRRGEGDCDSYSERRADKAETAQREVIERSVLRDRGEQGGIELERESIERRHQRHQ